MGHVGRWVGLAVLWSGMIVAGPVMAAEDAGEAMPSAAEQSAPAAPAPSVPAQTASEEPALAEPMRLSMEFQDANLKDVLKSFSQQTGINVIAAADVGDQPVTIYFEGVTVLDALDQILAAANLTYDRPAGSDIYIVKRKSEDATRTITRVYRLKYARVSESVLARAAAVFAGRTPFEASVESPTSSSNSSGSAGSSSFTGGVGAAPGTGPQGNIGIDAIVKKLLTDHGDVAVDGRTNSLIITDVPENFPRLEGALAALDVRTPQLMVDAEIIETTLSKLKDLGVEWGTGSEGDLIAFTPTSRKTRFPFSVFGDHVEPTDATHFTASTLDASFFKGVLQALESDTDTKILARPKVLTLDNESAVIRLTSDEAIGFESTTGVQSGTTTSEPERTTTGVVLVVTPQINDNGYITMIIEPSVTKTVASQISPPTGQATPRDPKTRSARTTVRVRSGDTLVVGGLIDRSDQQTLRRVPILSGIPFVGEAFKNTELNNTSSELMVFVTPRILPEASGQVAAKSGPGPFGAREQETGPSRQDSMEQTLNRLDRPAM